MRRFNFFKFKKYSPQKNTGYVSQDEIFKQVNPEKGEAGICVQMANLYTKYQLSSDKKNFFENNTAKEIYNASLKEREHQKQLIEKGKDGLHSAFFDTKTPYFVSSNKLKTPDLNKESLPKLVNNEMTNLLVTYSVKGTDEFHQVAFGRSKKGGCYSFSSNFAPKEHPCGSFDNDIVKEMQDLGSQDDYVTIAVAHR